MGLREFIDAVDKAVELRLDEFIAPVVWRRGGDLFEMAVAVVLSQNTSDRNAFKAFNRLKRRLGEIAPEAVLQLSDDELAELIKPAGMYRVRAKNIRALAEAFIRHGVTPEKLREMGPAEARKFLLSLPGIGEKTADVILVNLGLPAFPVDTHIRRIANRWGIGGNYGEISRRLMEAVPPEKYLEIHLKLIQFGRDICTARAPKCHICPIGSKCPSYTAASRR